MGSSSSAKQRVVIIFASTVSIACIALRFSAPISRTVKETWSALVVINFIIIAIAASTRFQVSKSQPSVHINLMTAKTPSPALLLPPQEEAGGRSAEFKPEGELESEKTVFDAAEDDELLVIEGKDRVCVNDESTASGYGAPPMQEIDPREAESLMRGREKPLVSSRFGHRRPIRTGLSRGGEARALLGVSRPRKQETLESTWKKISEGRHVPLTRHSKNSDTADTDASKTNNNNRSSSRMHKELSPSHVELNRRIEAFINNFNEDMKMQRQESMNRFMEMINRGV